MQTETLVREIIKSGHKLSLVVAGGGAEVIGELLRHGGASSLLLEAQVPYCQAAFDQYLGGKPDQYCSASVAADLAMKAWIRGTQLQRDATKLIGLAATSSLVKPEGERDGRQHNVYLATQTMLVTGVQSFEFLHQGQSREEEESAVSTIILNELARNSGCLRPLPMPKFVSKMQYRCESAIKEILELAFVTSMPETFLNYHEIIYHEIILNDHPKMCRAIYPGSFNPLHDGHRSVVEHFFKKSGIPVDFEISLSNVDKPPLNFIALEDRIQQFRQEAAKNRFMGNLLLTTTPYFRDKASLFQNSYFLMGDDTLARLIDPRYYSNEHREGEKKMEETFEHFIKKGNKLVVFPRHGYAHPSRIPPTLMRNVILIPESEYQSTNHSSSAIRKE